MSDVAFPTPLLVARKLTKRFGGVTAVDGIDFKVAEGELRCLIGPNGAGKSTFFKMLSGQTAPTSGTISFAGRDIARLERHQIAKAGVSIKTQVPSVFNGLTVTENLLIAARRHRQGARPADVLEAVIARVGLGAIRDREVGRLSHGERQLVEFGLVVATAPRLILLDEPAAGLSDVETERIAALIHQLHADTAIIVVDHDMPFIRLIGADVTVLHRGRILLEGSCETVLGDQRVRDVYLGRQALRHDAA
jgi:branched-chain amino acid transport system ATP-binding protein